MSDRERSFPDPSLPGAEEQLVAELLARLRDGDVAAREELFRVVGSELHALARQEMRKQSRQHTLQATALISEAYLKLFGREPTECRDKTHLLRAAALAMRQVLQDHARAKCAQRRAVPGSRVELGSGVGECSDDSARSFLEFCEELERLARASPDMARAIEMRFILGFSMEEIAQILHTRMRTFERRFQSAEALLAARLG